MLTLIIIALLVYFLWPIPAGFVRGMRDNWRRPGFWEDVKPTRLEYALFAFAGTIVLASQLYLAAN
jgi:hypothetical protein